jgi:hypothetical protein
MDKVRAAPVAVMLCWLLLTTGSVNGKCAAATADRLLQMRSATAVALLTL